MDEIFRVALNAIAGPVVVKKSAELGGQKQFGSQIGFSQATVSSWKKGAFPAGEIPLLARLMKRGLGEVLRQIAELCDILQAGEQLPPPMHITPGTIQIPSTKVRGVVREEAKDILSGGKKKRRTKKPSRKPERPLPASEPQQGRPSLHTRRHQG